MNRIELTVARVLPATPAEVFDLWLDTKRPGGPWFEKALEYVTVDATPDGLFHHRVRHEGRTWAHYGRFVRLERPHLIEHTWMSEATGGVESLVALILAPAGEGTQVTLRHTDVPDDTMGRQHEQGWTFILDAMARSLASSTHG